MINTILDSFVLGRRLSPFPEALTTSFARLEPDTIDYRETGFRSRLRCFSAYHIVDDVVVRDDTLVPFFNGKRDFHTRFSNTCVPQPDDALTRSGAIEAFLAALLPAMPLRGPAAYVYGVNQIRVVATDTHMGSPAPGLHQDGYAFSCHVNISRENVSGGASLLATGPDAEDIVVEYPLTPGEFVFFNDRIMFHTATPITPRVAGHETWRDMIIVDVLERP